METLSRLDGGGGGRGEEGECHPHSLWLWVCPLGCLRAGGSGPSKGRSKKLTSVLPRGRFPCASLPMAWFRYQNCNKVLEPG